MSSLSGPGSKDDSTSAWIHHFGWWHGLARRNRRLGIDVEGSDDSFPMAFPVLALFAGLSVGWGLWSVARSLDRATARLGSRLVGASATILGVGFGLELLPFDTWLAFFLAYTVGLFLLPVAYIVLGLGVLRSRVLPG
jgi:hypothetical protein